jgi:hypothetical protein
MTLIEERQIQSLKDTYKGAYHYRHVEKIIATLEPNYLKKKAKDVLSALYEFFPEDTFFLDELRKKLEKIKAIPRKECEKHN